MPRDPLDEVDWDDPDSDYEARKAFANEGSALRSSSPDNPRNLPCPNCGEPNRLTPADRARGYQCDTCAEKQERGYD
jgi:hypothetical protein